MKKASSFESWLNVIAVNLYRTGNQQLPNNQSEIIRAIILHINGIVEEGYIIKLNGSRRTTLPGLWHWVSPDTITRAVGIGRMWMSARNGYVSEDRILENILALATNIIGLEHDAVEGWVNNIQVADANSLEAF